MKILMVTGIFPPDLGGPASYVPAISNALCSDSDRVIGLITLSDSLDHNDSSYSFPIIRIKRYQFKPLRFLKTVFKIAKLAKNADVVFLNGLVLEGVIAAKFLKSRPVVIKVVGDLIWEKARNSGLNNVGLDHFNIHQPTLKWSLLHKLQGMYTSFADVVITPSNYLSNIVCGWGVEPQRVRVVYNAVELPSIDERKEKEWDLITVARLVPWKGIDDLICIASELNLSLKVVGDGPMRETLEDLANDLKARVSFIGDIDRNLVAKEIANASLFVLNSSYEGLPHIVLEAKLAGVAVIATNVGGTPETISHGINGWLIPFGSRFFLRSAIVQLLEDKALRAEIVKSAKQQVLAEFSFQKMVKETRSVLKGAVSGKSTT